MLRYIVRRVLWGVALLFIVSALIFLIFYVLPSGDPAAARAGRGATMVTTLALYSAPVFWLGLVLLYLFANDIGQFPIFPGQGAYTPISSGVLDWAKAMILPWIVLAAASAAIYARYLRSSLIDVMSEDYIRTARAKGLPERRVIMNHGVRSAITPIVTLLGLDIGVLLAGHARLTQSGVKLPGAGPPVF